MLFQQLSYSLELCMHVRHVTLKIREILGHAYARYNILTLGIGKIITFNSFFTRCTAPGQSNSCSAVFADIAIDHGDNVYRGTKIMRYTCRLPIIPRPFTAPAHKNGLGCHLQLGIGLCGKLMVGMKSEYIFELFSDHLPVFCSQFGI